MKIKNLRITSAFMALVVAGGITVGSINNCYAEENYKNNEIVSEFITEKEYKNGDFLDETIEYNGKKYWIYIVDNGDSLSIISRKICRFFKEKSLSSLWPTLAFLNGYPRIIKAGDYIIFPENYETMEKINNDLQITGWTSNYVLKNDVYNINTNDDINLTTDEMESIKSLLQNVYGENVDINDEFVYAYINLHKHERKYHDEDDVSLDFDTMITEWIPPIEEVETYKKTK